VREVHADRIGDPQGPLDDPAVAVIDLDVAQLWVQTPRIDFTLTDRIKDRNGVHAQWVMDKDLNPPATDTRQSASLTPGK
jgi:hypothetical protein